MSGQARACAAYLKDHPGYKRIMQELLKKYRSYGRPAGIVRLDDATQEECAAARGGLWPFLLPTAAVSDGTV